jgi:hypothetical protein
MSPRKQAAPSAGEIPTEVVKDRKGNPVLDKEGRELRRPVTTDISYPTHGGEYERVGPDVEHLVLRDPPVVEEHAEPAQE